MNDNNIFVIFFTLLIIHQTFQIAKSFPGAIGYGSTTRGAYSSTIEPIICIVDSLDASNTKTGTNRGTFEYCVKRTVPRVIIFEVSGVIDYSKTNSRYISLYNSYCSIFGQTAPIPIEKGKIGGITVFGTQFQISGCEHVIVQHIRFRLGDKCWDTLGCASQLDALFVGNANDIMIDHISASWSIDECISSIVTHRMTISNSLFYEPLSFSYHVNEAGEHEPEYHAMGPFWYECDEFSVVRNLIAFSQDRTPRSDTLNGVFINNFGYNENMPGITIYCRNSRGVTNNAVVGNVAFHTEDTSPSKYCGRVQDDLLPSSKLYFKDNMCVRSLENPSNSDWQNIQFYMTLTEQTSSPIDLSGYEIISSSLVENQVLNYSGAFYFKRDFHDKRVVEQVSKREGFAINSPFPLPARAGNLGVWRGLKTVDGNMENGFDWSSNNKEIIVNGKTISLTQNCANVNDVLNHLNSQMPSGTEAVKHRNTICNHIFLQTIATGSSASITVSGNGLADFGIKADTYNGEDGVGDLYYESSTHSLVIPDNPHEINPKTEYTNIEDWIHNMHSSVKEEYEKEINGGTDDKKAKQTLIITMTILGSVIGVIIITLVIGCIIMSVIVLKKKRLDIVNVKLVKSSQESMSSVGMEKDDVKSNFE